MIRIQLVVLSLAMLAAGFALGRALPQGSVARAQTGSRVFEIRTYTANEGKLSDLHARFRNHTLRLFEKHGMTNVGYWSPEDAPLSSNTLIYILAHDSRDAAKKSWDDFRQDPEWQKVQKESEASGKIVAKIDAVFMRTTDYSPMK
jgi:NIPSNAP